MSQDGLDLSCDHLYALEDEDVAARMEWIWVVRTVQYCTVHTPNAEAR
jgi:hypothetical protein